MWLHQPWFDKNSITGPGSGAPYLVPAHAVYSFLAPMPSQPDNLSNYGWRGHGWAWFCSPTPLAFHMQLFAHACVYRVVSGKFLFGCVWGWGGGKKGNRIITCSHIVAQDVGREREMLCIPPPPPFVCNSLSFSINCLFLLCYMYISWL